MRAALWDFGKFMTIYLACIVVPVGLLFVWWDSSVCQTESRIKTTDISGLDLEAVATNCDSIGNYTYISVFLSATNGDEKTRIMEYVPANDYFDGPLPTMAVSGNGHISISIPVVSEVYFRMHKWENRPIDYDIGNIVFPASEQKVD